MIRRTRGVIEDALPQTILTGAERPPDLRVHFGHVDSIGIEGLQRRRITLFEQGDQQMLGADVVVAVVSALLLGYSKHASCGWVKV